MKAVLATFLLPFASLATEMDCSQGFSPKIKKGEVKISYPCEAIPTPESVESEKITFFERKNNPEEDDLIIRHRSSEKEKDFTLKYRRPPGPAAMTIDKNIYDTLKMKDDLKEVNFKCEADVTYNSKGNKVVESCSLATPTDFFTPDHNAFMKMVDKTVPTNRDDLVPYEINSVSWKIANADFGKKGISIEKWLLRNVKGEELCILEVSGKFEIPKNSTDTLEQVYNRSMNNLKDAFPDLIPGQIQGNKTGRALSFLKAR